MAAESRMTVRLDPATRRKVERLATREGISLNEAVGRLLREAPDDGENRTSRMRRRYRLKPRKVGFGFDIASSRRLASEFSDERVLEWLDAQKPSAGAIVDVEG
jgi:hypothetical protein